MAINVKDKLVTLESLGVAYSTEQDAREEADQALSTRIDNIVAPEGDPSLTEVSDARVSGSTTYNTLKARLDADKAAIGTEISQLSADLDAVKEFTGDTDEPISYDLENSDFTRKVKFVYENSTPYPFTSSNDGFITYTAFDLPVVAGKQYTITAEVPSAYAETAGMIVIPYNQTLLDAYTNHESANTRLNTRASSGWQGLEQTITIPNANNLPCVGILLSFRQNSSNVAIDDNFVITSVHVEQVAETGSAVRYDLNQSKTDEEKSIARTNIGAASENDLEGVSEIIGVDYSPTIYELTNSDFSRKTKFVYGNSVAYPFTESNDSFITYTKFNMLPVEAGKQYKIKANVPAQFEASAGMIVIPYNQTLLDAYGNQEAANTSLNTRAKAGWGGLEQTITMPNANNEPCVGILLSFRQNSSNVAIDSHFAINSVIVEEAVDEGDVVRYDISQSKTVAEKKRARDNIGAAEGFYVTPQMFGAKGDGVTDDTVAFQDAINTGRNVFVPMRDGQKYVITSTLVFITIRQVIYGDIFNPDWGFGGCIYFDASNSVLFDFKHGMNGCGNLSMYTEGSDNIAVRFRKDFDPTNVDGSVINCSFKNFDTAIDHRGRGLCVKRNVFFGCRIAVKTTLANDPQWDHSNPNRTELIQTYPEYNGRSLFFVDNRFHLIYERYLLVISEDYTNEGTTIKQVLNGAVIIGNMSDLGYGGFEFRTPVKGCVFSNNEFLRVSQDVFFDCQQGAFNCNISNNTIRGVIDTSYPSMNMAGKDCFAFNGLEYSSISGNVVENFKQRCVYCYGAGMNNSAVIGNVFKNFGIDTTVNQYERAGFDVPNCENSIISNNTFMTVSDFNGYLIRARDVSSNVWKRNVFRDNTCTKRSSAEVLVPTTAGTEDNIIQGVS